MSEETPPDLAKRAYRKRKLRDAALVLPILGVFLLASPLITIFANDGQVLGLPTPFIYIFGVWILLVIAARRMAHLLDRE